MKVIVDLNPRPQFAAYLARRERWSVLVVHRRGGKTFVCVQDLLLKSLTYKRPGPPLRYGYIAPTRDQAKDITWGYLKEFVSPIPGAKVNNGELSVVLPGKAMIRLYSGESYDRMRGLYFDGVIVDEGADIDPRAWDEVIRPCLVDYQGWATFIGTPKGRNGFFTMHQKAAENKDGNWFSLVLPASRSGILPPAELADMRENMSEAAYAQEMECDFSVALLGAIYSKQVTRLRNSGAIGKVKHDAALPCWSFWDLGAPLNTCVWTVQFLRGEIRLLHCDAASDWTTAQRVATMTGRGYDYAGHVIPHDGGAKQKSGISYREELKRAGLRNVITLPRADDPNARIARLTGLFPSMLIDEENCRFGIEALENYRWAFDAKRKTYGERPHHDWCSHPCDALGYLAEAADCGVISLGPSGRRHPAKIISPIDGLGDTPWHGIVISPLD